MAAEGPIHLDLGEVAVIAEVWCNGKKVGTRWAPPFGFDLSTFVKPGKNTADREGDQYLAKPAHL